MESELSTLVRDNAWVTRVLRTVRESGIPRAWVGAGLWRDLVWDTKFGAGFDPSQVRDVDVTFFDPGNLERSYDDACTARLRHAWPEVPWEARNQAAVHTWYAAKFGGDPPPPLTSIAEAVATWPETATAVALLLDSDDQIEIVAPFGLDDLLSGVWRRNPRRVTRQRSLQRLRRHRPEQRWPQVTVIPP